MNIQSIRGTYDILPDTCHVWEWLETKARGLFCRFNFKEIRTPVFEQTELFMRTIGEQTDIVSKEMYSFLDRKNRSLTLRPEGTASIVRSFLEHKLLQENVVSKVFYMGPMFRYERPQAGRQRQFHQLGIEIIGSDKPVADIEAIFLLKSFFEEIGLDDVKFRINSTGSFEARSGLNKNLKDILASHIQDMCADCRVRYEKNVLRIYDCKNKNCQEIIKTLPGINELLGQDDIVHFTEVTKGLDALGIEYVIDNRLVRGLDYYTRTIFEAYSDKLGACDALAGGGRYDGLFKELGSSGNIGAVGFAVGIERVINILNRLNNLPVEKKPDIFMISSTAENAILNFKLIQKLRRLGFSVEFDLLNRNMKPQFRLASKINASIALIQGEEELMNNKIKVKNLALHEEIVCDSNDLIDKLNEILKYNCKEEGKR